MGLSQEVPVRCQPAIRAAFGMMLICTLQCSGNQPASFDGNYRETPNVHSMQLEVAPAHRCESAYLAAQRGLYEAGLETATNARQ